MQPAPKAVVRCVENATLPRGPPNDPETHQARTELLMIIEYDISIFPPRIDEFNVIAYTEGVLRVSVAGSLFLDAPGILLVEFAVVAHRWLRACESGPIELHYASMDFEDEPILALRYDAGSNLFRLESVWAVADVGSVSPLDAVVAVQQFLARLRGELRQEYNVDLDEQIQAADVEPPALSARTYS